MKQPREPMYNVNDLAKLYGVSRNTIYYWINKEGCPKPTLLMKCRKATQYYPLWQFKQFVDTIKRYNKC